MADINGVNSTGGINTGSTLAEQQQAYNQTGLAQYGNTLQGGLMYQAYQGDAQARSIADALMRALQNTARSGFNGGNGGFASGSFTRSGGIGQTGGFSANASFSSGFNINGGIGGGFSAGRFANSGGAGFNNGGNGGIFEQSNNIFAQAASLIEEQQRVGMASAEISAASGALQSALQALQAVSRNIGN